MEESSERVAFDFTLDEWADSNVRFLRSTTAGRSIRRREIWFTVGAFAVSLFVVALLMSGASSGAAIAVAALLAVVFGILFAAGYLPMHDWIVRSRIRRVLAEEVPPGRPLRCEVELRSTGAWIRQNAVEMLFPWSDATGVEDTSDGIEIRFRAGGVLARNRGFETDASRLRFLDRARALAPPVTNRPNTAG